MQTVGAVANANVPEIKKDWHKLLLFQAAKGFFLTICRCVSLCAKILLSATQILPTNTFNAPHFTKMNTFETNFWDLWYLPFLWIIVMLAFFKDMGTLKSLHFLKIVQQAFLEQYHLPPLKDPRLCCHHLYFFFLHSLRRSFHFLFSC